MSGSKTTWVLCDGASDPSAPDDALTVSLGGKQDSISIDFDGVDKTLGGEMSPRFLDLIRISTLVLGADGAVRRGALEDEDDRHWHRSFQFVVGVEDLEFWRDSGVADELASTLAFLSQDSFDFRFVKRHKTAAAKQLMFTAGDGTTFVPWDNVSTVAMFSGGLDSFTGAADTIFNEDGAPLLVSHRAATKVTKRQDTLFSGLQALAKERGIRTPHQLSVSVSKHDQRLKAEHTQRTRSLLYAAIGGAAARLIGIDEVRMYENGIVAINLPIAGSVVGTRATRTAHPRVLNGFTKILQKVADHPLTVANPYALMTRGEVLQVLSNTPAANHARDTISCAYVHNSSTMHPHCGTCSQCIDRRLSFIATGLTSLDPEEGYEHSIATGNWADGAKRNLLMNWLSSARRYASTSSREAFIDENGDAARACMAVADSLGKSNDFAAEKIFAMHRRQGEAVAQAVAKVRAAAANQKGTHQQGEFTLPILVAKEELATAGLRPTPAVEPGIRNEFRLDGTSWRIRFRSGDYFTAPNSIGMRYVATLLSDPGTAYTSDDLIAAAAGKERSDSCGIDANGKKAISHRICGLEQERNDAQEMCDEAEAQRLQAEIDQLKRLLTPTKPARTQNQRTAAAKALKDLRAAVDHLGTRLPQLRAHLEESLHVGQASWYRRSGMLWRVDTGVCGDDDADWVPLSQLVDRNNHAISNVKKVRQLCKKMQVPTRPGKTKAGNDHPRRRDAHKPSFDSAMKRCDDEANRLSDVVDKKLTRRERKDGNGADGNSRK